jgi:hypothetical protein
MYNEIMKFGIGNVNVLYYNESMKSTMKSLKSDIIVANFKKYSV